MSGGLNDLDLSVEADVRRYLENTAYKSEEVTPLSGGFTNFVFRLKLERPYLGKTRLVLKHGKGYVKEHHMISVKLDRQMYEVQALRVVRKWLPVGSVVRVPEVHLFDEERHVIIMDDAGEESMTLQTFVQQGRASMDLAKEIGREVGIFLRWLHKWGRENDEASAAVRGNEWGKRMSAELFYGDLKRVLVEKCKYYDPPVEVGEKQMEKLEDIVQETMRAIISEDRQFVMGDFWPGNVAVAVDEEGKLKEINVLDWELCKLGLAGMDIGQFCAELYLLTRFNGEVCGETGRVMMECFLEEYQPTEGEVRRAGVHVGSHLVVIPSFTVKGTSEIRRAVAAEGIEVMEYPEKGIIYELRHGK